MGERVTSPRRGRPSSSTARPPRRSPTACSRCACARDQEGLSSCEATFGNWGPTDGSVGFLYFDRDAARLRQGRSRSRSATRRSSPGRITGARGAASPRARPPELAVLAEDRFQDLRMTRRTRTFADVTDADVMQQIAGDHGLTADVDVTGPTHKVLAQLNQSDLAFLRERARAIDAELWIDGTTLQRQGRTRAAAARRVAARLRQRAARVHRARRPRRPAHRASTSPAGTSPASSALSEQADDVGRSARARRRRQRRQRAAARRSASARRPSRTPCR